MTKAVSTILIRDPQVIQIVEKERERCGAKAAASVAGRLIIERDSMKSTDDRIEAAVEKALRDRGLIGPTT